MLIKRGGETFQRAVEALIPAGSIMHVVPLSGGLDSRAILGALLKAGIGNEITTVTYGIPGSLDYEIGSIVARAAKLKNVRIDLNGVPLSHEALIDTARATGGRLHVFDPFYNSHIQKEFGPGALYWSGYMGDPLAGSHLLPRPSMTKAEAAGVFVKKNAYDVSNILVPHSDIAELERRVSSTLDCGERTLSFDELFDFTIRQDNYIRDIVLTPGFKYATPFLHSDWYNFILNVPNHHRIQQSLYKKILSRSYPALFSLPTKNNHGLPLECNKAQLLYRRAVNKLTRYVTLPLIRKPSLLFNYIDYDDAVRSRKDFKEVIYGSIYDLQKRGVIDWLKPVDVWCDHQKGSRECGTALTMLCSLELILKVEETIRG